ncbi:MAG: hypothetical protein M1814_003999 [Vezdaea aestivalis]|nr:MAG: hypothetical protein M1814_003999 [Vezdaea aestivalis]
MSFRRAVLRATLAPVTRSQSASPRTFVTAKAFALRPRQAVVGFQCQRRWASDESAAKDEERTSEAEPESQTLTEAASEAVETAKDTVAAAVGTAKETAQGAAESITDTAGEAASRASPKATQVNVYVGNLFFEVSEEDLHEKFKDSDGFGKVTLMKDQQGRSRGFAYAVMDNAEAAQAFIERFNNVVYAGRQLVLQQQLGNRRGAGVDRNTRALNEPTRHLYVGNLSFNMTDTELEQLFQGLDRVHAVRIAVDRRTNSPRGFAHVDFEDTEAADKGREILSTRSTYGRKLYVDFAKSRFT